MALRELPAVLAEDHRQVAEHRRRQAQRLVDEDLARGVRQVVVAADHMGDLHVRVVAYHGEVVGERPIGAADHHVVHDVGGEGHRAVDHVVEADGAAVLGNLQAPHVGLAGVDAPLRLLGGQAAARAVVARVAALPLLGELALAVELLLRAEAGVDRAALLQTLERRFVGPGALGLEIGTELAANLRALVPVEAEPAHGVDDDPRVLVRRALRVGVLDAQDEGALVRPRVGPVVDGRASPAHVQHPGGGGREAHADRAGFEVQIVAHGRCVPYSRCRYGPDRRPTAASSIGTTRPGPPRRRASTAKNQTARAKTPAPRGFLAAFFARRWTGGRATRTMATETTRAAPA